MLPVCLKRGGSVLLVESMYVTRRLPEDSVNFFVDDKELNNCQPLPDLGFSALSAMFRVFCSAHVALGFVIHHRSNSVLDLKGPNRSTFDKNSVSDWIKRNVHLEPQF